MSQTPRHLAVGTLSPQERASLTRKPPRPTEHHDPRELLAFIVQYKTEHDGNSPTVREIMRAVGISSTSVCNWHLDRLAQEGLIRRHPGKLGSARGIEVVGGHWSVRKTKGLAERSA